MPKYQSILFLSICLFAFIQYAWSQDEDPIIKLNISGTKSSAQYSTLTKVENSKLAKMVERWKYKHKDNISKEEMHIVANPDLFLKLIHLLTDKNSYRKPYSELSSAFINELRRFGVFDYIYKEHIVFYLFTKGCESKEDGKVCIKKAALEDLRLDEEKTMDFYTEPFWGKFASNGLDKIYFLKKDMDMFFSSSSSGPFHLDLFNPLTDLMVSSEYILINYDETTANSSDCFLISNGDIHCILGNRYFYYDHGLNKWRENPKPYILFYQKRGDKNISRQSCVNIDNDIYCTGGGYKRLISTGWFSPYDIRYEAIMLNLIYDTKKKQWRKRKPMHEARAFHSCVVANGKIYCFGGTDIKEKTDERIVLGSMEIYDPVNDLWENSLPEMDPPRYGHACAAVKNKIYCFGGTDINGDEVTKTDIFNIETKEWEDPIEYDTLNAYLPGKIVSVNVITKYDFNDD